jgi:hypothetical protein
MKGRREKGKKKGKWSKNIIKCTPYFFQTRKKKFFYHSIGITQKRH